jgi:hypothetical protein
MKRAILKDRSLILISGDDAEKFLENIVTCRVAGMAINAMAFGALLTPQGKIMFDFFILRREDGFLFDLPADIAEEFAKRMTFYKLRAKVDISSMDQLSVTALWGDNNDTGIEDPRLPTMGTRYYSDDLPESEDGNYDELRVANCMPEGGKDFEYGDAYPHETLMDQFGGVDFRKGCFVGQEVVSRMQHRGTVKKRIIMIRAEENLPPTGETILADGKPAGKLGTVCSTGGLALLRLDRVAKANELSTNGIILHPSLPEWVGFEMPGIENPGITDAG